MTKELVISSNRHETRVAVLEDDQVVEVYFQRENEYSLAGSIHKGRVTRVLPGMQSAFVDIGLERDAFLYVSDFFEDNEEYDKIVTSVEEKILRLEKGVPAAAGAVAAPAVENAPVKAAEAVQETPAPVTVAPPAQEPRPQREDRDNRDRRGRRSRRRRPGEKERPRRLPESKFYNPPREAAPPQAAAPQPGDDDFFVLPGESLAKYSHGEHDEEAEAPGGQTEAMTSVEPDDAEPPVKVVLGPESEDASELPGAAPDTLDLPGAVPEENGSGEEAEEEAVPEAASAEDVEPASAAAAEPEATEDIEPAVLEEPAAEVEEPAGEFETAAAEAPEAEGAEGEGAEAEGAEAETSEGEPAEVSETSENGPEPARIITSLTATLREQGPRYLHRVSRRMRRKGGRGPEGQEARPEPQPRGPRPEQQRTAARPETRERGEKGATPSISDLLHEGQEIIVQIAKEPLGQKGARITSHIALPGRFLVYMPTVDHIGVSRKIASDEERLRLKRILQAHRTGIPGGFIVRTAGEGHTEEELRADMMFLYNLWLDLRQKAEKRPAPALIHHDLDVVERILRDQLTSAFKSIWVDNEEVYENTLRFVQRFQPALVGRVKMYTRSTPVFDEFGITAELEKALRPKVWLKSGGYIVINQTEALVAIDVNTGKYVGKSNRLEDTIVKTNTDAIREIVRQIRLRDLGGIIVVDFIDMDERKNRQKVMQTLEESMRADRAPYKILQFNDFGLVAITRKRVKQSLERTLCAPCPYCDGAGYVKSVQTVIGEILEEARKIARAVEGEDVLLRVNPEVAKVLKSNANNFLQELEEVLGRTVMVKGDPLLHQEKFDLA